MKTFDLPAATRLKLIKTTPRKETHGKDLVQAISLRLEWWPDDNAALNMLHENLQDMIFWTPPEVAAQRALDGMPAVKQHIRCPAVARPWKVEGALSGYTLTIEYGIDDTTALELYACALDKFEVDAKAGGASPIRFSLASNKQVTPELVGLLCGLEGTEVVATLTPPAMQSEPLIDGSVEAFRRDHPESGQGDLLADGDAGAAGDATAEFERQHGGGERHAGDFGADDDTGAPGAGDSDNAGTAERGENWPFPQGDGTAGAVGGTQPAGDEPNWPTGEKPAADGDAAEFEAGAKAALEKAGGAPA